MGFIRFHFNQNFRKNSTLLSIFNFVHSRVRLIVIRCLIPRMAAAAAQGPDGSERLVDPGQRLSSQGVWNSAAAGASADWLQVNLKVAKTSAYYTRRQ